jgi:hypothetical protein
MVLEDVNDTRMVWPVLAFSLMYPVTAHLYEFFQNIISHLGEKLGTRYRNEIRVLSHIEYTKIQNRTMGQWDRGTFGQ